MKFIAILLVLSFVAGTTYAQTPPSGNPDKQVIATVLEKQITAQDKDRMNGLIVSTLIQKFATDNRIEPTEQEIDTFTRKTRELNPRLKADEMNMKETVIKDRKRLLAELQSGTLSDSDRKLKESHLKQIDKDFRPDGTMREAAAAKLRLMRRRMASGFVRHWKINKALFEKYGGRVIFQQAGPEPVDAYRDFLREQEKKGAFKILDKQYQAPFWRYFTNDAMHSFYSKEEGEKFINTPWWLMKQPTP